MNAEVKVSILVPCYNVEEYIEQCIDSIVNQTLEEIEIICLNDGSTDGTLDILNKYASEDERIIILNKENSGYGDSMNRGLKMASGKYIGIVESDDYIKHDMFEKLFRAADRYDLDVVKSNFFLWWSEDEKIDFFHFCSDDECNYIFEPRTYRDGTMYGRKPSIWSAIYKADFLKENEICFLSTPGASYQDTSFTFKVLSTANKMLCIPDALYFYRQDNEQSSVNNAGKKSQFVLREYEEIERFILDDFDINKDSDSKEDANSLYLKYICSFYDACIWMYELLGVSQRYSFLKQISPMFEKYIYEYGVENLPFGGCWWKRRDMVRIARSPFEYHIWRDDERTLQDKQTALKQVFKLGNANIEDCIIEKKESPFITVIIPVYNAENHLQACLDSLFNQSFENIEIICVNDGSTDDSKKILESYQLIDKRIEILSLENSGVSHARNMGISKARGEYILFLDADDYYSEDTCKCICRDLIVKNNPDMLVFGGKPFPEEYKPSEWFYKVLTTPDKYFAEVTADDIFSKPYLSIFCWRCAYKKEFLNNNNIHFDEEQNYGEDAIFMISSLKCASGISVISDTLYSYRYISAGSAMDELRKNPVDYAKEQIRILSKIVEYAVNNSLDETQELLEFSLDFIYDAINVCPMPEKLLIVKELLRIIDKNNLSKYEDSISDNGSGFLRWCREEIDNKKINSKVTVSCQARIRQFVLKLIPPSRAAFYDYMLLILRKLDEK